MCSVFFFFKQKTAYEMRISDWSSDVCSSDLNHGRLIANKPTRELVDMAREKIVVVTLDADVTTLPTHPAFEKVEREGERGLAIHYNKDRMNAGEVLAAVNAMGHGIVDVSTREADLEDVFLNLTRAANG